MKLRQSATPVVRYIRLLLNRYPIAAPRKQIGDGGPRENGARRAVGGAAGLPCGGTLPLRQPSRRLRQQQRAVKVRRSPRARNSHAPACTLEAPLWHTPWPARHHRPCRDRPRVRHCMHHLRAPPPAPQQARRTRGMGKASLLGSEWGGVARRSSQPPSWARSRRWATRYRCAPPHA